MSTSTQVEFFTGMSLDANSCEKSFGARTRKISRTFILCQISIVNKSQKTIQG